MKDAPTKRPGTSDPLTYVCTCPASESIEGGLVLLFYRYFENEPVLLACHDGERRELQSLEKFHRGICETYSLKGKIRIAEEGFNITVGGTSSSIQKYMQECTNHWSFSGLALTTPTEQASFFKPTRGCSCVFASLNIRICNEITPMGVTNYTPRNWSDVVALPPAEFHARSHASPSTLLLDVRNHYESRIGYFVSPHTGEPALRPPIRRFSQFPQYVRSHLSEFSPASEPEENAAAPRDILTYCTGGIRCEKGVRFLYDQLPTDVEKLKKKDSHVEHHPPRVYTLQGGIAAYLTWMENEIAAGRKTAEESLFKGKNYVFDARGSMGLPEEGIEEKVATCHGCGVSEDRMGKCRTLACHLVLVLCESCERTGVACCPGCERLGNEQDVLGPRNMCDCESEREKLLWGGKGKTVKSQGWKKQQKNKGIKMDIRIKTFH